VRNERCAVTLLNHRRNSLVMSLPTLAQAFEDIASGQQPEEVLSKFMEAFFQAKTAEARLSLLSDEPRISGQSRLDALAGAIAEYLAKQHRLPMVPSWVGDPRRYLERAWHVLLYRDERTGKLPLSDEGLREYLTFSSPAEFKSRNIFTEARPLRAPASDRPRGQGEPS
jgi:hypothetical protein